MFRIMEYIVYAADSLPNEDVDKFVSFVEELYSNFPNSASTFINVFFKYYLYIKNPFSYFQKKNVQVENDFPSFLHDLSEGFLVNIVESTSIPSSTTAPFLTVSFSHL